MRRPFHDGSKVTHEILLVVLLCVLAGSRVFLFSAAFPFFNNVDEEAHFDLVCKYARGNVPRSIDHFSGEAISLIIRHSSPEYFWGSSRFSSQKFLSPAKFWNAQVNHEATSPPVYYALAGVWYDLGKALGITDGHLLYWLRFFNVPVYALVVWFAYLFAKLAYPEKWALRLGLPALSAFFPQDVFYSINSDVLSALLVTASLYCVLRLYLDNIRSMSFHLLTGFLIAGSCLTKLSNLPLLLVTGAVLFLKGKKLSRAGKLPQGLSGFLGLAGTIVVLLMLWFGRNYFVLGDLTGSNEKIRRLGWTSKPLSEMWQHPIFTPYGVAIFWHGLLLTFWRGEFYWHGERLAMVGMDWFYSISSLLAVAAAVAGLFWRGERHEKSERAALVISIAVFALFSLLLIFFSILFDFGNSRYPSRGYPYFTSGRLISGVVVPFLILYLKGLDVMATCFRGGLIRLIGIVGIVAAVTASELILSLDVFKSRYNWYHLP